MIIGNNLQYMEELDWAYRVPSNILPPLSAYKFFPQGSDVKPPSKKCVGRIIFRGVYFDDVEEKHYEKFTHYLEKRKLKLPVTWDKPEVIRYLESVAFKYDKAYEAIWKTVKWRALHLPIKFDPFIQEIIDTGFMIVHGRDKNYRPIIYLYPERIIKAGILKRGIEDVTVPVVWIIEHILHYMLLPRQIENWIMILDLNKMSLKQLPRKLLKSVIDTGINHYKAKLAKLFVLDITNFLLFLWKIVETFIDSGTRKKFTVSKSPNPEALRTLIHRSQLIQKYGGDAPEPTSFWPPSCPSSTFFDEEDASMDLHYTEEEYMKELKSNKDLIPRSDMGHILLEEEEQGRVPPKKYYLNEGTLTKDELNISEWSRDKIEEQKTEDDIFMMADKDKGESDVINTINRDVEYIMQDEIENVSNSQNIILHQGAFDIISSSSLTEREVIECGMGMDEGSTVNQLMDGNLVHDMTHTQDINMQFKGSSDIIYSDHNYNRDLDINHINHINNINDISNRHEEIQNSHNIEQITGDNNPKIENIYTVVNSSHELPKSRIQNEDSKGRLEQMEERKSHSKGKSKKACACCYIF